MLHLTTSVAKLRRHSFSMLAGLIALGFAAVSPQTASSAQNAPTSIKVGRTCSCKTCSTIEVVSMETYVKRVLPAEWINSWPQESLKSGAIAIRTYAGYFVYHPVSSTMDICDNTCCQKYNTTQYTNSNTATDATANVYLVDTAGNIAFTEYCAEGNDGANRDGCGNCFIISKADDGICLSDNACCGATQNGHGRGMCQWGTQRWATQSQTHTWITDHYYAPYSYTRTTLAPVSGTVNVIVDNSNAGFTASANWTVGSSAGDKYGTDYRYRSTAAVTDNAQWTTTLPSAGTYTVYAWWSQGANRSATAPYVLPNGTTVKKNQQSGGGQWQIINSLSLNSGTNITKLSTWTATGFVVMADAIKYSK